MKKILILISLILVSCKENIKSHNNSAYSAPKVEHTEEQLRDQISIYNERLDEMNVETYQFYEKLTLQEQVKALKGVVRAIDLMPEKMKEEILNLNGKLILMGVKIPDHPDNAHLRGVITSDGFSTDTFNGVSRGVNAYVYGKNGGTATFALHEWAHVYDFIYWQKFGLYISESATYLSVHKTRKWAKDDPNREPVEGFAFTLSSALLGWKGTNETEWNFVQDLFPNHNFHAN